MPEGPMAQVSGGSVPFVDLRKLGGSSSETEESEKQAQILDSKSAEEKTWFSTLKKEKSW